MSLDHYIQRVMSGVERGAMAATWRACLAAAEPLYAAAVTWRNRRYDRDPNRSRRLPRPVISIGNITTGGTGKTPIVRWLAAHLRDEGRRVAILSRGYKAGRAALGDEQVMLDRLLNDSPSRPPVVIRADPDRLAAGMAALRDHPDLDVFLLDDGFQHRRVARDLDVVLINAAEPFGYGRVLPRGLLREPLAGLRRADAIVLTHALAVDDVGRARIVDAIRRHHPTAPIYRCVHAQAGVGFARTTRDAAVIAAANATIGSPVASSTDLPLETLRKVRLFAFCGIGSPAGFERELRGLTSPDGFAGHRWFADHHAYTAADLQSVRRAAREAGADVLVTTEKDWVKLADLPGARDTDLPVWRLDVAARFLDDDGERLLMQVRGAIG